MSDMSQVEILSTKEQIKEFISDNLVWRDIQNELNVWVEAFDIEKNNIVDNAADTNPSTASVLMHLGDLNGRAKAVRFILTLPELLLSILEEKKNDTIIE